VSATSQEQIRNSGAGNITDFARNVAGLTMPILARGKARSRSAASARVRSFATSRASRKQVGVYLDESAISVALFTPDLELFDLDRIEVLRGPQGTLFRRRVRSGHGSAISPPNPKLGMVEGLVDGSVEVPKSGSVGGSGRLAVNFPIGENRRRPVGRVRAPPAGFHRFHSTGRRHQEGPSNDGDRAG